MSEGSPQIEATSADPRRGVEYGRLIFLSTTEAALNLAAEEIIHQDVNAGAALPAVLAYVNDECVILGRGNETVKWVNRTRAEEMGVHVFRRMSGGGAVVHHTANVNLSLILPRTLVPARAVRDFLAFFGCIVAGALRTFGLDAHHTRISDVSVGDYKVSGSACYLKANAALIHGTVMLDERLDLVDVLLPIPPDRSPDMPHASFIRGLWTLGAHVGVNEVVGAFAAAAASALKLPIIAESVTIDESRLAPIIARHNDPAWVYSR